MKLYSKSEYLSTDIFLKKSIYRKELLEIQIKNNYFKNISGHNVGRNNAKTIKSAFAEYYERINLLSKQKGYLKSFRLLTGEESSINKKHILFNEESFNDTCGVASHINSIDSINNAFLEFLERQSLIYTWLNKFKGIKFDPNELKNLNMKIRSKMDTLENFVDHIYLFNISIFSSVSVIFGIGIGKNNKCVGLSAHWNIIEAVNSTLDEMIEFFGSSFHKEESMDINIENKENLNTEVSYMEYFDSLSVDELIEKYCFLIESSPQRFEETNQDDTVLIDVVKKVEEEHGIQIFATQIPTRFAKDTFKVVKVFSPQGYPHMNIPLFSSKDRSKYNVEMIINQNVDLIPFP